MKIHSRDKIGSRGSATELTKEKEMWNLHTKICTNVIAAI